MEEDLRFSQPFQVLEAGAYATIGDVDLVPGDTVCLKTSIDARGGGHHLIPADCVLIQGSVAVNEATLTGECAPIQKIPVGKATQATTKICDLTKKNILFAGTQVLDCSPDAKAIVIATGGNTRKGLLLKEMVFADVSAPNQMTKELSTIFPLVGLSVALLFILNSTMQFVTLGVFSQYWAFLVSRVLKWEKCENHWKLFVGRTLSLSCIVYITRRGGARVKNFL